MTDNDKQQLAELGSFPAFRLLVGLFKDHERQLLNELAHCTMDLDVINCTRRYQAFRYVREFLEAQPLAAERALEELKAKQDAWDSVPRSIDELLRSRYARNFATDEEEVLS